ncbi:MAG: hypothetical protein V1676_02910 [Candidatus Diapherotrites archaeon]
MVLNLWIPLLALAIAVFAIVTTKCKELLKPAVIMGLALVVIDFIGEYLGSAMGLWQVNPETSLLMLGPAPVEVLLIAFFAGATYYYILAPKTDFKRMVFTALMISTAGMALENELVAAGHIIYNPAAGTGTIEDIFANLLATGTSYPRPWNPVYAFISYFAVFTALFFMKGFIHNTFAGKAALKCRCFEGD